MKIKKIYPKAICNWPEDDRPREKLIKYGEHTLSNAELLGILIRTGTSGKSAVDIARELFQKFKTLRTMSGTDENRAKYKAGENHFNILNSQQSKNKYFFNFLTPEDYDYYFDHLRKKNYKFNSKLDAELEKNGGYK